MSKDGLTDAQREQLRESFRRGIGYRPTAEEFRLQADEAAKMIASITQLPSD